jgi:PAS domain S-box-containing protein
MPSRQWEKLYWIITYMVLSTIFIFYIDLITPLGFAAWILYFIPLFLSLYTGWKNAPFFSAGIFIMLIAVAFFISPRDISILFALFDRIFFSLMLIVTAVFIRNYTGAMEDLRISEERYRYLTVWSPETIVVYGEEKILCVNPAGLHLFFADSARELVGKNILDLVEPEDREIVGERIRQAGLGAQMTIDRVRMHRLDGSDFLAELSLGKVPWDGSPAVQIILHDIANR